MGNMFGDLFALLGQQGPDAWFVNASQLALNVARGADGDPNPLPAERQRLEELAPLVGRHVDALFTLAASYEVNAVNRSGLTVLALEQWKPLLTPLVQNSSGTPDLSGIEGGAMMAQVASALGPLFFGFQLGSVAGHFAERAWSLGVLPLPRTTRQKTFVVNNLHTFADEWSLHRDVLYTFALAREFVADVILNQPGTGDALRALLLDAVHEAAAAQANIVTRLQGMMNPETMASLMSDPEQLLEGIALPEATAVSGAINAATAALAAYFDAAALTITETMHGPQPTLREAWQRYRRTDARGEDAAAALFSIALQGPHHDEAQEFVRSLIETHGLGVFDAFLRVDGLPSATELRQPQQWLERVSNSPLA
jgi:uncharacterized protein (DUF2342 family)